MDKQDVLNELKNINNDLKNMQYTVRGIIKKIEKDKLESN